MIEAQQGLQKAVAGSDISYPRGIISACLGKEGGKSSLSCVNRPEKQAGDQVFPCSWGLFITVKRISNNFALNLMRLPVHQSIDWEKTARYNILSLSIADFIRLWNTSVCYGSGNTGTIVHSVDQNENGAHSRSLGRVFCSVLLADHMVEAFMPSVL